jgi:hypothetical protein
VEIGICPGRVQLDARGQNGTDGGMLCRIDFSDPFDGE